MEKTTIYPKVITQESRETSQFFWPRKWTSRRHSCSYNVRFLSRSLHRSYGTSKKQQSPQHWKPSQVRPHKEKEIVYKKTRRGGRRHKNPKQCTLHSTGQNKEINSNVLNISKRPLKEKEISLLAKGLNFCPNRHFDLFNTILDVNRFSRTLTLRKHFLDSSMEKKKGLFGFQWYRWVSPFTHNFYWSLCIKWLNWISRQSDPSPTDSTDI